MLLLQTIRDRASLLPIIATSLARMKNAESPSLRQKAASFAARVADGSCNYGDAVVRGIEKGTWDVLLSTIKLPPRSHRRTRNGKGAELQAGPGPATELCEPNAVLPDMETQGDDIDMTVTLPDMHDQTDCEVTTSFQQQDAQFSSQATNAAPFAWSYDCPPESEANDSFSPDGTLAESNCTFDANSITEDSTDYDASPFKLEFLESFDEWLYSGDPNKGNMDISCEAEFPSQTYGCG